MRKPPEGISFTVLRQRLLCFNLATDAVESFPVSEEISAAAAAAAWRKQSPCRVRHRL